MSTPTPPNHPPPVKLTYSIHSTSGFTSAFVPSHILVDAPTDQASRWTGCTNKPGPAASNEHSGSASGTSTPNRQAASSSSSSSTTEGKAKRRRESQYVTIELEQPAIVTSIGFGKFQKVHPCNLYEFSIYGGMSPDYRYMEPLLHSTLKNDSTPESFKLPIEVSGVGDRAGALLPCKYIRIDAISPHTQNYNVSLWHVWLEGVDDPISVERAVSAYEAFRTTQTTHHILSHLRRTSPSLLPTFTSLLASLPAPLARSFEHPLLSRLHNVLVVQGDFLAAESVLEQMRAEGLYREWEVGGGKGVSVARWERLDDPAKVESGRAPSGRGGHQMVRVGRKLLLFGGWDGERDLGDLWEAELPRSANDEDRRVEWRCLEEDGTVGERPSGRSCHQMAVDDREGWVYLLGGKDVHGAGADEEATATTMTTDPIPIPAPTTEPRSTTNGAGGDGEDHEMDDGEEATTTTTTTTTTNGNGDAATAAPRRPKNLWASDFWRYKAVGPGRGKWELLCEDTSVVGGPKLLFDHQMIVHAESSKLFVFGGRIQPLSEEDSLDERYSGMYCYDIPSKTWSHLFGDPTSTDAFQSERLLARIGHSMLFDTISQTLYILSGQRGDSYLSDLWAIELASPSSSATRAPSSTGDSHWRQGAVIDSPFSSSSSSSSSTTRQPTILSISLLTSDYSLIGPPAAFTQRASIDPSSGEWTLMSGLVKDAKAKTEVAGREVWLRTKEGVWEKVEGRGDEPGERYAAQVVYDPLRKEHYLFGGNPSKRGDEGRLSDFWRLRVVRPSPEEALRVAKFQVRKQKFTEMCRTHPTLVALSYLQTTLSSVVDHSDPSEASSFRSCMSAVLSAPPAHNCEVAMDEGTGGNGGDDLSSSQESEHEDGRKDEWLYRQRQDLFERLCGFVPEGERQPKEDLRDLATRREML